MGVGRLKLGALLAVAATCLVALTGTAGAHGPEATFTPIAQEPVASELAVNLRVTLIYDNDSEPVDDATVKVTPVDASGAEAARLSLPRVSEPGTYEGVVPVTESGDWTFKLVSEDPDAALDLVIAIPEPAPAATAAPTTEAPATSAKPKEAPVPSSLPDDGADDGPSTTAAPDDAATTAAQQDDGEGGFPWGIAVLVAVVAAGVAMAMAYGMRPGSEDPEGDGDDVPRISRG